MGAAPWVSAAPPPGPVVILGAFPAMPGGVCRLPRAARTFRRMAHSVQTERKEDLLSPKNGLEHPSQCGTLFVESSVNPGVAGRPNPP